MKDFKDTNKTRRFPYKGQKGGDSSPHVVVTEVNDKYSHIQPVQAQPLEVIVYHNNFDKAFRAFRALIQKERVLSSYKERQSYEKPSDKFRRKRNEMKRKRMELDNPRPERDARKSFKRKAKPSDSSE